ncbi:helix-turn-helix transcriptional regulator [Streptomyces sp. NBC_00249]|uniref:response regulator transcription factor n=1 Tax=Streptomyces sp. NBC_00249 TaxID=2975690 RepID=UPI00225216FC|nr:helix-turn-helix transcriptional regulator [Streptomyces sp. NBC_00249]MCX5195912.1 helix-turn-helix transcriptional regulator [Streptomyces sp. NBC_00249]
MPEADMPGKWCGSGREGAAPSAVTFPGNAFPYDSTHPGDPAEEATERSVYGHIRAHGCLDPAVLAQDLGIGLRPADAALSRLIRRHLVRPDADDASRGRVLSPQAALDHIDTEFAARVAAEALAHQQRLAALRADVHRVTRSTEDETPGSASDAVTVLPDLVAVNEMLEKEAARCRYEVLACQPGTVSRDPANLEPALVRDRALLERGVRMRTLQQHVVRFHGPTQAYVLAATALGGEYRTAHELFGRLIVFDDTVAFLPTDTVTSGAVVVREPHLIAYLRSLFEQAWTHATEFVDPAALGAEGLERVARDIDTTLLKLLAAGLKDETIARRLGMSLRTVRRHVADILETLGAQNRFQAAVIATRNGLLDHPDSPDTGSAPA